MTTNTQEYSFQAEMNQLLQLIIHSLYSHKEIFLRELISSSSDALNKMRFLSLTEKDIFDPDKELKIHITIDEKEKTITLTDTGIGMDKEELIQNIGTIAKSGTMQFLQEAKKKPDGKIDDLIGQFGVGFYSVFMVTDEVTLKTRSYKKDSIGLEWKSQGTDSYIITEIDKPDRGTEIIFRLKEDAEEFGQEYRIKNIIQKYSNFVEFPIYMEKINTTEDEKEDEKEDKEKDEKPTVEKINSVSAIWRKSPNEVTEEERKEFYQFIANDFSDPIGHLHLKAEAPLEYSALLFIPGSSAQMMYQKPDDFQLSLYIKRVFIQNDSKDLLPQYLRFIRGVVDSEDLPLNVSREVTQSSPVLAKIRKALTNRLLKVFEEWAVKDKEKFEKFYKEFGNILKEGVHLDFENKDRLVELLRFKSTKTQDQEMISLADYSKRMQADQKEIYYIAGESLDSIKKNPNLEYFRKNDIEVLLLDEAIDDFIVPSIDNYQEKPIKNIEKSDINIQESKIETPDDLDGTTREGFLQKIRDVLGDKIKDAAESKRLVESPCTLVASSEGMTSHMEKMMKMMDANYTGAKKIFEINMTNPIIKNLINTYKANENDIHLQDGIMVLYEGALLMDGNLENPADFLTKFHNFMEKATGSRIIT